MLGRWVWLVLARSKSHTALVHSLLLLSLTRIRDVGLWLVKLPKNPEEEGLLSSDCQALASVLVLSQFLSLVKLQRVLLKLHQWRGYEVPLHACVYMHVCVCVLLHMMLSFAHAKWLQLI